MVPPRVANFGISNDGFLDDLAMLRYPAHETRYLVHGPSYAYKKIVDCYQDVAAMWNSSSLLMDQICKANGIRDVHFLQPNHEEPLYADACCHPNEAGNQILGHVIGQTIRALVQERAPDL